MPKPRNRQIIPGQPGFYHCVSRCVRRAWLCGRDPLTARCYDHRRDWIVERMKVLSSCFAIDIYAYAIMSNHTHIVLFVDPERIDSLSDAEVIRRYRTIWHWRHPDKPLLLPTTIDSQELNQWRKRLGDVSWFMRALKEPIARIANSEDGCKGSFWESRFKSIPLLDEAALLAGMTYVDLNPIKAGVCETLEDSDYTSIKERMLALVNSVASNDDSRLSPLIGEGEKTPMGELGITTESYVDLVRSTAINLVNQRVDLHHAELSRLALSGRGWMAIATDFLSLFRSAAGGSAAFETFMECTSRQRRQDKHGRSVLFLT